jgi:hypothetical protein
VTAEQRLFGATVDCTVHLTALQFAPEVRAEVRGAPDSEQCLSGATRSQRSNNRLRQNPNGWVTWLAYRTVRSAHRQQPAPTVVLVGDGYKYPSTTTTPTIQAFNTPHSIQEKSATLQDTNQSLRSNQSPQFNSSALGLVRGSFLCFFIALIAWLAFFFLSVLFSKHCKRSKRHQLCGGPCWVLVTREIKEESSLGLGVTV